MLGHQRHKERKQCVNAEDNYRKEQNDKQNDTCIFQYGFEIGPRNFLKLRPTFYKKCAKSFKQIGSFC